VRERFSCSFEFLSLGSLFFFPVLVLKQLVIKARDTDCVVVLAGRGGRSGYLKILGRIIRVFKISGFENRYSKLQWVSQYPKIWVPEILGSGIPELPELLCWLNKNTYTLLN
jgi:membrane protein YqaA with SNARE-associated domain